MLNSSCVIVRLNWSYYWLVFLLLFVGFVFVVGWPFLHWCSSFCVASHLFSLSINFSCCWAYIIVLFDHFYHGSIPLTNVWFLLLLFGSFCYVVQFFLLLMFQVNSFCIVDRLSMLFINVSCYRSTFLLLLFNYFCYC